MKLLSEKNIRILAIKDTLFWRKNRIQIKQYMKMGNQYEKTKPKNTNTLERKRIINGKEIEYEEYTNGTRYIILEISEETYEGRSTMERRESYSRRIKYKNEELTEEETISYEEFKEFFDNRYRKATDERKRSDIKLRRNKYYVYYD